MEHIDRVHVIGMGRAGTVLAARCAERGVQVTSGRDPESASDLVLICVPDHAIRTVASRIQPGPWIAHVSGATPLNALDPHRRRFGLHPLIAFDPARPTSQMDGVWAAVAGETPEATEIAAALAGLLGLTPFELDEAARPVYHAAASIASNYLVALQRSAARLFASVGVPEEALVPLMRGTLEGGFPLTGPIARGDWDTVAMHVAAIRMHAADLLPMYQELAAVTARLADQPLPAWLRREPAG